MPRCLLCLLLPRCWADPRASQWTAQLYLLRFQGVCEHWLSWLSFQIDAHHREDDARLEKNQSRGDDMEVVFVEEVDSGEEVGVQADGVNGGGVAGLAVVRVL